MKLTKLLLITIVTALLLAVSFAAGFLLPDAVRAYTQREFIASLQLLPERVERLANPSGDDQSLPIVDTYWTVLNELSAKYYGKKIDQQQMSYAAIRGMLEG